MNEQVIGFQVAFATKVAELSASLASRSRKERLEARRSLLEWAATALGCTIEEKPDDFGTMHSPWWWFSKDANWWRVRPVRLGAARQLHFQAEGQIHWRTKHCLHMPPDQLAHELATTFLPES